MKIDGFNNINNIKNINIKKTESEIKLFKESLEKAKESAQKKKLGSVCKQFEQIFINTLLKNMRNTVVDGGLIEKSYAREMYESMLDEEIAKQVSKGQGIGIAKLMYEQLSKNIKEENQNNTEENNRL